ncbi:MAG: hypothetical protein OHK93_005161 [Ramalina farinacea]|uniref:Uncharacterized protein n=1 Tax=Ramalina farinacea TaxID=258253 RepID=A0AA43QYS2_9LECA|nr:hypothetical protein [Ramalina farinacea]
MVQCFNHALEIHAAQSVGAGVAILDGYEVGVSAEIIAVEDELDVRSQDVGEQMGECSLASGGRTTDAEPEDGGLLRGDLLTDVMVVVKCRIRRGEANDGVMYSRLFSSFVYE